MHQYGYWQPVEAEDYAAPQSLQDYLSHGEKPVYIGFGSIFHAEAKDEIYAMIIDALRMCGKRGIISGMDRLKFCRTLYMLVNEAPHSWLPFSQMPSGKMRPFSFSA